MFKAMASDFNKIQQDFKYLYILSVKKLCKKQIPFLK